MKFPIMRNVFLAFFFFSFNVNGFSADTLKVSSPGGVQRLEIYHETTGELKYAVFYKGKAVILPSALGMRLKKPEVILERFDLIKTEQKKNDNSWKPVWGEVREIQNKYNELVLNLKNR